MTQEQTVQAILDRAAERSRLEQVKNLLRTNALVRGVIERTVAERPEHNEDTIEASALTIALYCTEQFALSLLEPVKPA